MSRLHDPGKDRVSQFERAVVFKVARAYFLAMAAIAVLTFSGGIIMGMRGLLKTPIAEPNRPQPPSDRKAISLALVQEELARDAERAKNVGSKLAIQDEGPSGSSTQGASDPLQDRLDSLVQSLRALFPEPTYVWTNQIERICAAPTSFGCLRWENHIKKSGVLGALDTALEDLLKGVPKTARKETMVSYLDVLVRVLKDAPVEKRLELIEPIFQTEKRSRARQADLEAAYKVKSSEVEDQFQAEKRANDQKHEGWTALGVYGVGAGFGLLIVVSLFLAFLSMERHTRMLEKLSNVSS